MKASRIGLAVGALALAACGKLQGLGGPAPPLASFEVTFSGDIAPLRPPGGPAAPSLHVALLWGAQWLTEPFCVLPPENDAAAAVIAAGCRDPFGFVPQVVAASAPLVEGGPTTLTLEALPGADVMVGDVTARVAYGSLVVFDDDGSGSLELASPRRTRARGDDPNESGFSSSADVIYGASFLTMTEPDRRAAYREGAFVPSAFYPRGGCATPPRPGFSVVGAGGFSAAAGVAAALAGQLPPEDPATCFESAPGETVVDIQARPPLEVQEVGCVERRTDSTTRYREPPADAPDLTGRLTACAHLPSFDAGTQSGLIQLVVSSPDRDRCKGLTHYTLRGCRENVSCPVPDWDFTATPPAWWPCPQ